MIRTIAIKEIKSLLREKKCRIVAVVLLLLFATALVTSAVNQKQLNKARAEAQQLSRSEWLAQSPKNPHSAAHFGNFAFRLKTPLSLFDKGLDTYTGSQVFLEPHKQDDFKFSEAEDADALVRFGELTPAFILQTILPLLIIFLSFATVSKEREDNTLKLLVGNGTPLPEIVAGKILGNWAVISGLIALLSLTALLFIPAKSTEDTVKRFVWMLLSYVLYAGFIITISVVISTYSKTSKASLMKLLSLWMLAVIIVPKVSSNIGSTLYATPSQFEYANLVQHDVENGLDGHNPLDKRRDALLQSTLKKYAVDTITKLPVNFDAIAMMESEKYTTEVYRKRIAEVRNIFTKQNNISLLGSFINPFQAVQYCSMALSGTDYAHFIHFQDAAEDYRLYFVNTMNEFMAKHTRGGDWRTKFGAETYQLVTPFHYSAPSLSWSIRQQPVSFIALLVWVALSMLLIRSTKKINIV
ncbi:MAG: DUF3526 domain-containing protein [Sphingobacteriales bacterium]|nr:DUF3526 domain-containing protein [Sphingobacteriales bacterium]OJY86210.1 MAG: hypothetical protein BGP14_17200 [Sphingobacteriales bacterium 44-15]